MTDQPEIDQPEIDQPEIDQPEHDLTPEDALAFLISAGAVGTMAEWRAVIISGLALGYSLDGIYMIHMRARSMPPADLGSMLVRFSEVTKNLPPLRVRPGTIRKMVDPGRG